MPDAVESHRDTSAGRMRSRSVGLRRGGVPEVVVVQGMAVADYLMPAVAELGRWTRAHLVELPGLAGSGEATRRLDVPGYAAAVAEWLEVTGLAPVVLAGHSSGTQVAARAAVQAAERGSGAVLGVVLASPTVAPVARPLPRMLLRWRLDGRHEPPGLTDSHRREWRRAGLRTLVRLVRVHLRDRIEEVVPALGVPVLVLRGAQDRLTTTGWASGARRCRHLRPLPGASRRALLPVGGSGRLERADPAPGTRGGSMMRALLTVLERTGRPRCREGLSSTWTSLDGLRVHARVLAAAPAGAPDVVLLHGLVVSSRYLLPLAGELAPHFRVHVPDLPGFGHSDHPPAALDVPGLAAALLAWVEAAALLAPVLVANSMGCQVAVAAMRRRPGVFDRAVLVGPTFDRRGRNRIAQAGRLLRTAVHERPSLAAILVRDYLACGPARALATARHGLEYRLEDDLPRLTAPVLVVRGGADAVVPQRWAQEVTDGLPDGRLAVLPGHGHALNYSAPGPLAAAIRPFLGGPPPGPDAPTSRPAADSIASFDSATVVLRGTASCLRGEDLPVLVPCPARWRHSSNG